MCSINGDRISEVASAEIIQGQDCQAGGIDSQPTIEQLDTELAAMGHLQRDLSLESYRIKRRRNALVPFHRLPGEIFVSILLKVAKYNEPGFDKEHKRLHTLAQVSTYWLDTILSFPSFWHQLAQYHPPYFREMALKRNPSGLFNIDCVLAQDDRGPTYFPLLSFMKMAAPLSERWKLLAYEGEMTDEMAELIQSPAPNLDGLLISSWDSNSRGSRVLELVEGRNIQYLDIDNIAVPWDSSRLRGLRGVQIQHITGIVPSLAELGAMLAASPALWWLQLSSWFPYDDGVGLAEEISQGQSGPIILPHMTTIILHQIPSAVTQFLLSSITGPACQCVILREVPCAVLNNPTSSATFAALVNNALKGIGRARMMCRKDKSPLHLLSDPPRTISYNWIHHVDEVPGLNIQIPMQGLSDRQLGSFLGLLNFPTEVEVLTDINGVHWASSLMHVKWQQVPRLRVSSALAVQTICAQLANMPPNTSSPRGLQSFTSPLDSSCTQQGVYDSIAQNLIAYVQQTCTRTRMDQRLDDNSDEELNCRRLEIKLPRLMIQKLRKAVQGWDVQLSEFGQDDFV